MGGDGGSIPKRADMVKTKGYSSAQGSSVGSMGYNPNLQRKVVEENVDPKRQRQLWMTRCWLTGQTLEEPIAACRAGYLYNKETVFRYLLEKQITKLPKHVTSIRDVIDVKFKRSGNGRVVCPITGKELDDGVHKSAVIWPCGCVVGLKALGFESGEKQCINCATPIESVVKLYPEEKSEQDRQLGNAYELRHKKSGAKGDVSADVSLKRKNLEGEQVNPKQTRVYDKIFHSTRS
jgi:hypothetical protein